jgi:hypothetical protein
MDATASSAHDDSKKLLMSRSHWMLHSVWPASDAIASDTPMTTTSTRASADTTSDAGPAFDAAATSVRRVFLEKHSRTSPLFLASGAKENKRFISMKAPNPAEQTRQEGERTPNPSLPLKLHLLRKCANTTKCTSPCACVLTFSAIILKELG